MKSIVLLLLLAAFITCADDTDYRIGYITGGHKMQAAIARQGAEMRNEMLDRLGPRMIFFAVMSVTVTLFGSEIVEALRRRIKHIFRFGRRAEYAIAWTGYLGINAGILIYGLIEHGLFRSAPIAILLAGTVWPFIHVLRGIMEDNRELRKAGIGRIKMLWFLSLVVAMVWRLLLKGLGNIKIG